MLVRNINRSALGYGSGFNATELMTLKIALVAPMPSAIVAIAIMANPGERRNKRNNDKSLEHRTLDLENGLLALFPDHNYDPGIIAHLAKSFAEVLFNEQFGGLTQSLHASNPSLRRDIEVGIEQADEGLASEFTEATLERVKNKARQK